MRVLVAHNRYQASNPSGENEVVDSEIAALTHAGVEVVPYLRSSDEIASWSTGQKLTLMTRPVWSRSAIADVRRLIAHARPDVVHLHNPYPLLSPGVVIAANQQRVPVVQTVHNHRHVCMNGVHFRDGHVCHDCVGRRVPWPGVAHGCYRGSRAQSVPMAAAIALHRPTWQRVNMFLALTESLSDYLQQAVGIAAERIAVRPNTVDDPGPPSDAPADGQFLFIGRLSVEKGPQLLLDAWDLGPPHPSAHLTIVGDGAMRSALEARTRGRADITLTGQLTSQQVQEQIRTATCVVIPSVCPEVFPRVAVEALAAGRPVVATDLGGLPSIVSEDAGWICSATPEALAAALSRAARFDNGRAAAARGRYEQRYHPTVVLRQLLDVYREVSSRAG